MRSSRFSFVLCVGISAAVHGVLLWKLPRGPDYAARPKPSAASVVPLVRPEPPPLAPAWGEAGGVGESINSTPSDQAQSAPKPLLEQASLTRDPTGDRGKPPTEPPRPLSTPVTAPPPSAVPTPPEPAKPSPLAWRPPPKPPSPQTPPQKPAPQREPSPPAPPPQPAGGGVPIRHSDQDSDLFAKETSVEFQPGRVTARNGRWVKFASPRDNLASAVDGAMIARPARLRVRIDVDVDNRVRNVTILESTGSSSIDRILELAIYQSQFEAAKDAAGRPVRSKAEFSIGLS